MTSKQRKEANKADKKAAATGGGGKRRQNDDDNDGNDGVVQDFGSVRI
jgi:hypothetical protein